jgi:undecaprenyl-diphosphatase
MIARPRPFDTYSFIIKLSQAGGFSFPSGHTMEAFCVATSLALLFPEKKIILPAFLWAVLVAYSRLALGVHFPSDILGGVVMGAVSATSVFYLMRKYELKRIL